MANSVSSGRITHALTTRLLHMQFGPQNHRLSNPFVTEIVTWYHLECFQWVGRVGLRGFPAWVGWETSGED